MTDEELEHRLTDVESRSKSNTHRLDDLERLTDAVNGMNTNIKLTIQQLESTNKQNPKPTLFRPEDQRYRLHPCPFC